MEIEKLKKLHRYAAVMAGFFFVAGFIKASFHDGNASVAADVWLFGLSVYLPFYVLYSEGTGVIQIPYGGEIRKDTEVIGFRLAQGLYSIGAITFFCSQWVRSHNKWLLSDAPTLALRCAAKPRR